MNYAIGITPKFGAVFSLIGVSLIIYRFFKTPRADRKTHDRLMLGMSIMNLLAGLAFLMSQWPYAYIEPGKPSSSSFCNWQGWALQQQSAVFWYNSVLVTVFMLKIRFGWHEEEVAKYEPYMHVVAMLYPTITSFTALGLKLYGTAGPWCWIHAKHDWARWTFFYGVLWPAMIYSTCCMLVIVRVVKRSDERTQSLRSSRIGNLTAPKLGRQTRIVAVQAALYVVTFLFTWACGTANRIQGAVSIMSATPCSLFGLMWFSAFCIPFQGFGNFLVYIYPRIRDVRRQAKLATRERLAQNTSITRKQMMINYCIGAYTVIFGVGPILSPSQIAAESDTGKDSATIEKQSRSQSTTLEMSTMRPSSLTSRPTSASVAPSLVTRGSISSSTPAQFAFLGLGPSSSVPANVESTLLPLTPTLSHPATPSSQNHTNIDVS